MRSRKIARITTASPPSKPRPTWSLVIPRITTAPSPPAPTIPAITTIDRANMITWLTPAMMVGRANGICMRVSICSGDDPNASPASTTSLSTCLIPNSVSLTAGAWRIPLSPPRPAPSRFEESNGWNKIYKRRHGLHEVQNRTEDSTHQFTSGGGDTQRYAYQHRHGAGRDQQRHRVHGLFPESHPVYHQETRCGEGAECQAAHPPGEEAQKQSHGPGRLEAQDVRQDRDQPVQHITYTIEERG